MVPEGEGDRSQQRGRHTVGPSIGGRGVTHPLTTDGQATFVLAGNLLHIAPDADLAIRLQACSVEYIGGDLVDFKACLCVRLTWSRWLKRLMKAIPISSFSPMARAIFKAQCGMCRGSCHLKVGWW